VILDLDRTLEIGNVNTCGLAWTTSAWRKSELLETQGVSILCRRSRCQENLLSMASRDSGRARLRPSLRRGLARQEARPLELVQGHLASHPNPTAAHGRGSRDRRMRLSLEILPDQFILLSE
jgi:hypothetical protein